MNDNIVEQIESFIEKKMGKYKKPMSRNTTLEHDLGITGDDASELLLDFSKEFNVDVSNFNMQTYFLPEGDTLLPSIIRMFRGKKNPKQKELSIGHLEKAIIAGRLDEQIINS